MNHSGSLAANGLAADSTPPTESTDVPAVRPLVQDAPDQGSTVADTAAKRPMLGGVVAEWMGYRHTFYLTGGLLDQGTRSRSEAEIAGLLVVAAIGFSINRVSSGMK